MTENFTKLLEGYQLFKTEYSSENKKLLDELASGQAPKVMMIACCDSRVDPAIVLQCDPGDLFVVRNIANIVPPYEADEKHHGTSASLEYGICYLEVEHLIILGHSQCGGINAYLNHRLLAKQDEFLSHWIGLIEIDEHLKDADSCSKASLLNSYKNCLSFPWIKERVEQKKLKIHLWFFDISEVAIYSFDPTRYKFFPLPYDKEST